MHRLRVQKPGASGTSATIRKSRKHKWGLSVVAFCLLLAMLRWQVSFNRVGLRQHQEAARGSMHQVELYSYRYTKDMKWRTWDDFPENSNLMLLDDDKLASESEVVPIGVAHKQGLFHRGIWIAVLRENRGAHEILLLRRAPTLKTCPGAWGLCGEHSDPGEDWVDTARRALQEELQIEDMTLTIVNLLPGQSVLVRTPYIDLRRRDLQATGILAVVLFPEQADSVQPDDEVADIKWVPIDELQAMHACNAEISALARFVGQRLVQKGIT